MLQQGLVQCFTVPNIVILATCVMFEYHVGVTTLEDCRLGWVNLYQNLEIEKYTVCGKLI